MQTVELAIMLEVARNTGKKIMAFNPGMIAEVLNMDQHGNARLRRTDTPREFEPFMAPLTYMVGTPSNLTWRIQPESREVLAKIATEWHIRIHVQYMHPHLAAIREAYPGVSFYTIKDHRLTDIRRHALIAQYGFTTQGVDSGPALFKSFAIDLGGLITYAEVEAWRYEPADIEALYTAAI